MTIQLPCLLSLSIGDRIDLRATTPARGIQAGADCEPLWFAFTVPPSGEDRARDWLLAEGVSDAWFPTERFWRSVPRGKRRSVEVVRAAVRGYVFARFTAEPQWDVLRASRYLGRPVGMDGQPMPITDAGMARMEQVPHRLAVIRDSQREARTVRAGDRVMVRDGVMQGWIVDVSEVSAGLARLLAPMLGDRLPLVPVDRLEKLAPGAATQGLA